MHREGGGLNYLMLCRNRAGITAFLVHVLLMETWSSEQPSLFAGTATFFHQAHKGCSLCRARSPPLSLPLCGGAEPTSVHPRGI